MAFRVGQKVVCVDDSTCRGVGLRNGQVYTVTGLGQINSRPFIFLAEAKTIIAGFFFSYRFRPVVERKTDISIFTALLNPANHKRLEDVS